MKLYRVATMSALVVTSFLAGCGAEIDPNVIVTFEETPDATSLVGYAKFQFSATGAAAFECSLDQAEFAQCTSPLFIEYVSEGAHLFSVRGVNADNVNGVQSDFEWTVENVISTGHQDLAPTNVMPDAVAPNSWRGIFRINCDFAHSSYNDPIVFPGMENAAHLHRFYGNDQVDHLTTTESLYTTGDSTCQGGQLNLSSYWLPALLAPLHDQITGERKLDENGDPAWQAVSAVVGNDEEAHEIFYYSAGVDDLESIQPVPPGLRMIAGDHSTLPGTEQDTSIVRWHCQSWESDDASNPVFSASIPECEAPDRVRLDIFFPSCWNGTDLDSLDHKSHMSYPINDGGPLGTHCPDSHPVAIVRPTYHYAFGVTPDVYDPQTHTSRNWRIASDMYEAGVDGPGGLSLHADWMNGWHPSVMEAILENCIKAELDCHDGNLANGYRLSGTQPGTQEEPAIINQGLGGMDM